MNLRVKRFLRKNVPGPILVRMKKRLQRSLEPAHRWAYEQSHAVVNAGGDPSEIRDGFERYGIVKIRDMLTRDEVAQLLAAIKEHTGVDDADYEPVQQGKKKAFAAAGFAANTPDLWPTVLHPRVVACGTAALGERPVYAGNDKVSVNANSFSFHRDMPGEPSVAKYTEVTQAMVSSLLRVVFPVAQPGRPTYRFAFHPFSHLVDGPVGGGSEPMWLAVEPGDCLMFNPWLIHTGEKLCGPKYFYTFTYGARNALAEEYFFRNLYGNHNGNAYMPAPELLRRLKEEDLLMPGMVDPDVQRRYREQIAVEGKPLGFVEYENY